MAVSGLNGPYELTESSINRNVIRVSPGTYVLGRAGNSGNFSIEYVGRSDVNLATRLLQWLDEYPKFKFGYFDTPKAAFERECRIYHDFGGSDRLDNKIHPQRPQNSNWGCPACDLFDS